MRDTSLLFGISHERYKPSVWYNPWEIHVSYLVVVHVGLVYEDYDSPYEDLLAKCHMSTQYCQRSRTLVTDVCKAVNGTIPNYIHELFEVKEIPYNLGNPTRTIIPKI